MNLTDYAISKGGTAKIGCPVLASTASSAKCSAATLYMISRGHKQVSARLAVRIATATEQQVTAGDLRPDLFAAAGAPVVAEIRALVDSRMNKRALMARLGLSNDRHLAKLLDLPVEQVSGWADEDMVPALPQVMKLLGHEQQEPASPANDDPDSDRIAPIEVA